MSFINLFSIILQFYIDNFAELWYYKQAKQFTTK